MPDIFDPDKFINCSPERQCFEDMLSFKIRARLLSIQSPSGTGKSLLLKKFKHRCFTANPSIPVSLVQCDPLIQPIDLIQELKKDLSNWIKFPTYERVYDALVAEDFDSVLSVKRQYRFYGVVNAQGANFEGSTNAKVVGTVIETFQAVGFSTDEVKDLVGIRTLTEQQRSLAHAVCIQAFIKDINYYLQQSKKRKIVLLFDTYEASSVALSDWLLRDFLLKKFYDLMKPSKRMLVVIAGQSTPIYKVHWSEELVDATVNTVSKLSPWTEEDVKRCMVTRGVNDDVMEATAQHIHPLATRVTPIVLVQLIDAIAINGQRN